ncbi:alpha/beta hydrolase [Kitasatospora sp. CM 4170]|uniref:Alpha/beta fold hydrolase n=1 Tax=Kitasatospora aburaviensis TaxID=67265 RepID=A0ABW1F6B6_9ACTN|nr:alpha/beta hydrolase [Kitasatospora sp. CM 4170]WNM49092.1 alpha/beta hydrolase [Kitasatospora sp. CM 4170]
MPTLIAPDGTELAYRVLGEGAGAPLVCLPGGPMRDSAYLGDLGGLPAHRRLIVADQRGAGLSATPADPASYRCDRLVGDVEVLREHLGLDRMDLLAHSAAANLAVRYAEQHPHRVGRLVLITPGTNAAGLEVNGDDRREVARLRRDEPWYAAASAAFDAIDAGEAAAADWVTIAPFLYGRWDGTAQAHRAAEESQWNAAAAEVFGSEGAFDPGATRAALAALDTPVLVLAGEFDLASPPHVTARLAALFPRAEFVVQPGAGHYPWLDDADGFVSTTVRFLS